jgi:hypothetical protein
VQARSNAIEISETVHRAHRLLRAFVELHDHAIREKVRIMAEHFQLNGFPESQTKDAFERAENRFLHLLVDVPAFRRRSCPVSPFQCPVFKCNSGSTPTGPACRDSTSISSTWIPERSAITCWRRIIPKADRRRRSSCGWGSIGIDRGNWLRSFARWGRRTTPSARCGRSMGASTSWRARSAARPSGPYGSLIPSEPGLDSLQHTRGGHRHE